MAYVVAEHHAGVSWVGVVYIVIGVFVAASKGYLVFTSISSILSALLAIILWPLLLFGVDLHLALGA